MISVTEFQRSYFWSNISLTPHWLEALANLWGCWSSRVHLFWYVCDQWWHSLQQTFHCMRCSWMSTTSRCSNPQQSQRECHDLAKWLSHYLYFFSFLIGLTTTRWSVGKYHVTLSQCHNGVMECHRSQITVCHMTRVTWGLWESKRIATVVKYISSREISKDSIEFSLSNSKQRDSWLNSGHRTLDANSEHVEQWVIRDLLGCEQVFWGPEIGRN